MHLHSENYEMLIREIKVDLNKCSGIGSLNLIKISILSKLIYRFSVSPIKIPGKKNFEKEQGGKSHSPWFQNLTYGCDNHDCMVLLE